MTALNEQIDLSGVVDAERRHLPRSVLAVPSMLSYDERALLHWAARSGCPPAGAIVDAGCFLGGSTLALGLGLRQRETERHAASEPVTIHSFDLFEVGEERERVYFDDSFPFVVGASTRRVYESNIAPVHDRVRVHAGDINQLLAWEEPIALLFIDIAKSWTTNDTVTRRFFPCLQPGSIVIQQDLVHFGHPWCALTMELLDQYVDFLGFVPYSSAVYRVRRAIPSEAIPPDLSNAVSADDSVRLINRCAARIGAPYEGYVRLAAAGALAHYREADRALRIIAEIEAEYDDAALPWISEHIAMVSRFVETYGRR